MAALATVAATLVATTPAQAGGGVTVYWPAATQKLNAAAYVTGHVPSPGTVAILQQRVSGGWANVARVGLNRYRNFRIRLHTNWLGPRTYRVVSNSSQVWGSANRNMNVIVYYNPPGWRSEYRYTSSKVTRWDSCAPIGYRVNLSQATSGALADTHRAFAAIGQAYGVRFVYRGTTTGIPQYGGNSWYPADTQVVVAWARRSQSSLFALYPGAVGVGAAMHTSGYYLGDGTPANRITKGMVVIDSAVKYPGGFGSGTTRGDVLIHELGHVVGLSHIGTTRQHMYPYMTGGATILGRGDLHAMWQWGGRLGCLEKSLLRTATTTASAGLMPQALRHEGMHDESHDHGLAPGQHLAAQD